MRYPFFLYGGAPLHLPDVKFYQSGWHLGPVATHVGGVGANEP